MFLVTVCLSGVSPGRVAVYVPEVVACTVAPQDPDHLVPTVLHGVVQGRSVTWTHTSIITPHERPRTVFTIIRTRNTKHNHINTSFSNIYSMTNIQESISLIALWKKSSDSCIITSMSPSWKSWMLSKVTIFRGESVSPDNFFMVLLERTNSPSWLGALTSAPACSSSSTIERWPCWHASCCKGVIITSVTELLLNAPSNVNLKPKQHYVGKFVGLFFQIKE